MIDTIRIGMLSDGDPAVYQRYLDLLHGLQSVGEISILEINEDLAKVRVLDPRLIRVLGGRDDWAQ